MFLLTCLFLVGLGLVNAQSKSVSGKVISGEDGQPIIGATVKVKGTFVGTITGGEGDFKINLSGNEKKLVISFIGMKPVEVDAQNGMVVKLDAATSQLEEVLVVAYGTAKKSAFTGSATKVSGDRINYKSPTEVSKALAGEVAGVQVFNTNGQPGSNATIRIRGIGSVNSSNDPLYVIDGMPFSGDLSSLSPADIESTTVLKDATAAALYGSRASNGVILITTKKGEKGVTKVEAEVKHGFNTRLISLYDNISSPERFTELTWEGLKNKYQYAGGKSEADAIAGANADLFSQGGIAAGYNMWSTSGDQLINGATGKFNAGVTRKYTPENWSDYIFRTGQKTDVSVKISGGSDKSKYFTSFGYVKDEGYYIGSDFNRFNIRSNLNNDISSWLKSNVNLAYSYLNYNAPGQTDNMNNGFQFVNYMPSLFPVFQRDADGNKIKDTVVGGYLYDYGIASGSGRAYASGINPAGAIQLDKNETTTHDFNGTSMLEARFLKNFKATVNFGLQYYGNINNDLTNPYYGDAAGLGRIDKTSRSFVNFTSNQILSWNKKIGSHSIDAFVAHESMFYNLSEMEGQKSLLVRPDNTEWSNAVIMGNMDSKTLGYSMESYFGQIRYDYNEKYHFNVSLRSDGSSRFAKGNRWGTFGSVGAAWVLSKESFLRDIAWLKNLKYKASWGILGNQDLNTGVASADFYPYEDLYTISNQNDKPSIILLYKGNPKLTWEHSSTFNTGFEFNIADRVDGEVEYFNKATTNMLFMKQVAPSLGYAKYPVNDGEMVNQGLEVTLHANVIKTNAVKFDVRLNGGYYKNEMTKMPIDETTGKEKPLEVQGNYGWSKGHSYYDFYLREYAGVDPQTGLALYNQYYNVKADGTKELITDMVAYTSKNAINKLEIVTTDDYGQATKKYVGKSAIPVVSGGFGFDLAVKGFELSSTFTYALGGYAIDAVYQTLMGDNTPGNCNWSTDIENRWRKPGDITDVPRLTAGYDSYTNSTSTRFLTSRSYLNLSNVRLGYNIPKKVIDKVKLSKLSLYVTGENLFLLSARQGFVAMSSVSGASTRSQYLPVSTIMGGIKIEF